MNLKNVLEKINIKSVIIKTTFLEVEFDLQEDDKNAAWEMYIELITRITVQKLPDDVGVEKAALDSVYSLFGITRNILKEKGRNAKNFSRVAIIVLNVAIRPFTAKWHKASIDGELELPDKKETFRRELEVLQEKLMGYCSILAEMACVEDLTEIMDAQLLGKLT